MPGQLSVAASLYKRGGSIDAWAGVAAVYAAGGHVYGASACVDITGGTVSVNDPSCGAAGAKAVEAG